MMSFKKVIILASSLFISLSSVNFIYANDTYSVQTDSNEYTNHIKLLTSGVDEDKRVRYAVWSVVPDDSNYVVYRRNILGNLIEEIPISNSSSLVYYEEPIDKALSINLSLGISSDDEILYEDESIFYPAIDIHNVQCNASTRGFNQITVTWSFLDDSPKLTDYKYNVYRNGDLYKVGLTNNLLVDTDLNCGTTYTYQIEPYYTVDGAEICGSKSNAVNVDINKHKVKITSLKPNNETKKIKISISEDSEANVYRIFRSTYNEKKKEYSAYREISRLDSLKYTDTVKNGKYKYKVQAGFVYDNEKWGEMSETKNTKVSRSKKEILKEQRKKEQAEKEKWGSTSNAVEVTMESAIPRPEIPEDTSGLTPILGKNDITVEQMESYFSNYHGVYPEDIYKDLGAPTFHDFCVLLTDICDEYSVRNSIVFAQVMCETGMFKFSPSVAPEQCNFAGIGVTGGSSGMSFDSVKEGLTYQVQHLRLYADPNYVRPDKGAVWSSYYAGKCPYLEWTSIPHNPYGLGWAMSDSYYEALIAIMEKVMSF